MLNVSSALCCRNFTLPPVLVQVEFSSLPVGPGYNGHTSWGFLITPAWARSRKSKRASLMSKHLLSIEDRPPLSAGIHMGSFLLNCLWNCLFFFIAAHLQLACEHKLSNTQAQNSLKTFGLVGTGWLSVHVYSSLSTCQNELAGKPASDQVLVANGCEHWLVFSGGGGGGDRQNETILFHYLYKFV